MTRIKLNQWRRVCAAAGLSILMAAAARAEDTYETLTVGTNTFKNVRIIKASPVDLLIGHDEGFKRVKLQDLPEPLKARYPFDARKAVEYEKQQAKERQRILAQNTAAARATLLDREAQLRSKIKTLQKDLKRINKGITTQDRLKKGRGPNSPARRQADELRLEKMAVRDQIWTLQDELERTELQRRKLE